MNYSNMIEEKALKKTFIIATLVSTIVGTFTASMGLHDKIKERQEKAANAKKQQGVDNKQDQGLEEVKARLGELENKADKGKEETVYDKKASQSRSRSRSSDRSRRSSRKSRKRSRARRRECRMEDDEFRQSTGRSKAMLEQAYEENFGQLGQAFAQGDLVTENALQKQVIDLQQVVINVLQGAVSDNRALSDGDMRQIITAQDKARDGSISALNAQRDRLLAGQQRKEQGDKPWDAYAAPPTAPPARSERGPMKALPPAGTPQLVLWERTPSDRRSMYERERAYAPSSRRDSYRAPPPPNNPRDAYPSPYGPASSPSRRRSTYGDPSAPAPSRRGSAEKYGDPFAPAPSEKPKDKYPDPFAAPTANRAKDKYPDPFATAPPDMRGEKHPDPFAAAVIGAGAATAAATAAATIAATQKAKHYREEPPKGNQAVCTVVDDGPNKGKLTKGAPSRILPDEPKWRPPPPPALFCRYAQDLQRDPFRALDKAFSRSGTHACPACHHPIPVDTRDVWVLSTHNPQASGTAQAHRDYRMDARFVVKCHMADGRGQFACVLCDRWRDMDCVCRDVDALVKHLGTAHTPDEFETDGDLVRMKDGSIVVKSREGREMALA